MKYEIKSVGVISSMKIYGAIGLVIGALYGAVIFVLLLIGGISAAAFGGNNGNGGGLILVLIGFVAWIAITIAFTLIEAIVGGIFTVLYNLFAKTVGGLEVNLEEKK